MPVRSAWPTTPPPDRRDRRVVALCGGGVRREAQRPSALGALVEGAEDEAGEGFGLEERRLLGHALTGGGDGLDLVDGDRPEEEGSVEGALGHGPGNGYGIGAVVQVGRPPGVL